MLGSLLLELAKNPKAAFAAITRSNLNKFINYYTAVEPSALEIKVRRKLLDRVPSPDSFITAMKNVPRISDGAGGRGVSSGYPSGKKALIIDRFVPEYDQDSGSLRIYTIMKILLYLGYKVTFLPDDLHRTEPYASDLVSLGVTVLHKPLVVEQYLAKEGPSFAYVILCRPAQAAKYMPLVRTHAVNSKVVYDTVDLHWLRFERNYRATGNRELLERARNYKSVELMCASQADITFAITPEERDVLLSEDPSLKVEVCPNIHTVISREIPPFQQRKDLMFLGGYSHEPNEDAVLYFIRDILPLIRRTLPDVRFFVVGSSPSSRLLKLNSENIVVTGYVRDLKEHFDHCRVFVAPLRYGAGMNGKIGHSMSYGLPVVTTKIGAEGLELINQVNALIADDTESFADAVIALYKDEKLWRDCSVKSFEIIKHKYSEEAIEQKIEKIFNSLAI